MPDPAPTTETETHINNVIPEVSETKEETIPNLRRSGMKQHRTPHVSGFKKFRKHIGLKKRRPFSGAYPQGTAILPATTPSATPPADALTAPLVSVEDSKASEEKETQLTRRNTDNRHSPPMFEDSFVMNLNDQQFKIKPSIVYDTSPTSHSTGSIIKELFSDQFGSRHYQVREPPGSPSLPQPPYLPTQQPVYRAAQPTPYYEEVAPGLPTYYEPTPSYSPLETTPAPSYYQESIPSYSASGAQSLGPPQLQRVKKESVSQRPEAAPCDCLAPPLSPACSSLCPDIASDRQGLGAAVPIVSQTQEMNQDATQSHAFE
jgi:hypothetical protein